MSGIEQSHQRSAIQPNRQMVLAEQETKAQLYSEDWRQLDALRGKYPSRSIEVFKLYLKGSWLCLNNGFPDYDKGAPTEELAAAAYDSGINYIKQAIQRDLTFPLLYIALGEYLKMKSIHLSDDHLKTESEALEKEALASFKKAAQLDSSNPDAYFGIARTTPSTDLDERIRNLLIVERLDPKYPGVHGLLASNYEMKGDWEKAFEENIKAFNDPGEPAEKVDRLERLAQESKQYSLLLPGYVAFVDHDPRPASFDRVLFAVSPYRPKMLKEGPSLNLESLIAHGELADFLVQVGAKAIEKQKQYTVSYAPKSAQTPQGPLIDFAERFFKKAMELDRSKAKEIRKIAESSQLDQLKKFAGELPR